MGTDVRFGLQQQGNPTGTPPVTQDFTDAAGLGGATAKGLITFGTTAAVAGTERDAFTTSIGAANGTNQFVTSLTDIMPLGLQGGSKRAATTRTILLNNAGANLISAAFSAFIANGVTVNYTAVDATPRLQNGLILGGADLLFKCGTLALSATLNGTATVDLTAGGGWTTGIAPHVVLLFGGPLAFNDAHSTSLFYSMGMAHNGGTITQRCFAYMATLNSDPTVYAGRISNTRCMGHAATSGAMTEYELTAFNATATPGFTITTRSGGAPATFTVGYVAMHFGDLQSGIFDLNTPTVFGLGTITLGCEPQMLFIMQTMLEAFNSSNTTGLASSWGLSAVLPHIEGCMGCWSQDNVTDTNVGTIVDILAANLRPHDGSTTDDIQATGPSGDGAFDSTSAALAFSEFAATQKRWFGFWVEARPVVVPLVKKYRIPTNAPDGTQRRLYVFSDTSYSTTLVSNVLVTASGGFFKYEDATLVLGVTRPAMLLSHGADATTAAFGGACWASAIEEVA